MRVCIFEVFELKFTVICLSLRNWIKIGIKDSRIPIFIIFLMERVGSVLEKAAAQSVDAATTALIPGLSSKLLILSIMQTIMCSVPTPFFPANWLMLRLLRISSIIHSIKNFSKIFGKSLVDAIFLTSVRVFKGPLI